MSRKVILVRVGLTTKKASDWGMRDCVLTRRSLATDEFTFTMPVENLAKSPEIGEANAWELVEVFTSDADDAGAPTGSPVRLFQGLLVPQTCADSGGAVSRAFRAVNWWFYAENVNYLQPVFADNSGSTLCLLFMNTASETGKWTWVFPSVSGDHAKLPGATSTYDASYTWLPGTKLITCGEQIYDTISWLASIMASSQLGLVCGQARSAVEPSGLYVPPVQKFDLKVSEVLRVALEKSPDVVAWTDYSTATPTVWFEKQSSLRPVSIALSDAVQDLNLQSMNHLVVPAAHFQYWRTHTIDGRTRKEVIHDYWPVDAFDASTKQIKPAYMFGAMVQTFFLEGIQITNAVHEYSGPPIAMSGVGASKAPSDVWWQLWVKELQDASVTGFYWDTDGDATADAYGTTQTPSKTANVTQEMQTHLEGTGWLALAVNLITGFTTDIRSALRVGTWWTVEAGSLPPWLIGAGNPYAAYKVRFLLRANMVYAAKGTERAKAHWIEKTVTNLPPGIYRKAASTVTQEPSPLDFGFSLAKHVYDTLGKVYHAGSVTLKQQECLQSVKVGQKLNVTGSAAEHAAMDAIVQQVSEHFDSGTTTVQLGMPQWLGAAEMVDFMRISRFRVKWADPRLLGDSEKMSGQSEVQFPSLASLQDSFGAAGVWSTLNVTNPTDKRTATQITNSVPMVRQFWMGQTASELKADVDNKGGSLKLGAFEDQAGNSFTSVAELTAFGKGKLLLLGTGTAVIDPAQLSAGETTSFFTVVGCFQNPDGTWTQKSFKVWGVAPA